MKIKKFLMMFVVMIALLFLFAGCSKDMDIELRVDGEYIQWSYEGEDDWNNAFNIQTIKQLLGETYKGDEGQQGPQGIAGKQVEFRVNEDFVQWHYVGDEDWNNLISVLELENDISSKINPQHLAFYPLDDGNYGVDVGNATQLSTITIPDTYLDKKVTRIIDDGFNNLTKVKAIVISSNITDVGIGCFRGSNDVVLYCKHTSQPITFDSQWNRSCKVYWYSENEPEALGGNYWYYVDGKPTTWFNDNPENKTTINATDVFFDLKTTLTTYNGGNTTTSNVIFNTKSYTENNGRITPLSEFPDIINIPEIDFGDNLDKLSLEYEIKNVSKSNNIYFEMKNIFLDSSQILVTEIEYTVNNTSYQINIDNVEQVSINGDGNIDINTLEVPDEGVLTITINYTLNTRSQPVIFNLNNLIELKPNR